MSQIWYAAFSEDFVEQAQQIFKKLDKDVIVTVWDPELVPEMLTRFTISIDGDLFKAAIIFTDNGTL